MSVGSRLFICRYAVLLFVGSLLWPALASPRLLAQVPEAGAGPVGGSWRPDPERALLLALVLPASGQVYNRQLWKLPLVMGSAAALVYATNRQQQLYAYTEAALANLLDSNPLTQNPFETLSEARLRNSLERFRRDRDFFYILFAVLYGLQALEAYVAAHLWDFDSDTRLSGHPGPRIHWQLIPTHTTAPQTLGLSVRVYF